MGGESCVHGWLIHAWAVSHGWGFLRVESCLGGESWTGVPGGWEAEGGGVPVAYPTPRATRVGTLFGQAESQRPIAMQAGSQRPTAGQAPPPPTQSNTPTLPCPFPPTQSDPPTLLCPPLPHRGQQSDSVSVHQVSCFSSGSDQGWRLAPAASNLASTEAASILPAAAAAAHHSSSSPAQAQAQALHTVLLNTELQPGSSTTLHYQVGREACGGRAVSGTWRGWGACGGAEAGAPRGRGGGAVSRVWWVTRGGALTPCMCHEGGAGGGLAWLCMRVPTLNHTTPQANRTVHPASCSCQHPPRFMLLPAPTPLHATASNCLATVPPPSFPHLRHHTEAPTHPPPPSQPASCPSAYAH